MDKYEQEELETIRSFKFPPGLLLRCMYIWIIIIITITIILNILLFYFIFSTSFISGMKIFRS